MFFWREKSRDKVILANLVNSLKIKEQLEKQTEILKKIGILNVLGDGKSLGILGTDNKEYKIPSLEEILLRLEGHKDLLKEKVGQGFTKLIMVPFACPLEKIIEKYKDSLVKHWNNNQLLATKTKINDKEERLELDLENSINVWGECKDGDTKNNFAYFPKTFDKEKHQGKTKTELLVSPENAWQIFFVEDLPNLPIIGKGKKVGHRKQIEIGKTPAEYLNMLQTNKTYQGEEGLIPEADLMYAITYLEETNQVINDWQGKGNISYELGAFLVPSDSVSWLGWDRDFKRADLWKSKTTNKDSHTGIRVGIRI